MASLHIAFPFSREYPNDYDNNSSLDSEEDSPPYDPLSLHAIGDVLKTRSKASQLHRVMKRKLTEEENKVKTRTIDWKLLYEVLFHKILPCESTNKNNACKQLNLTECDMRIRSVLNSDTFLQKRDLIFYKEPRLRNLIVKKEEECFIPCILRSYNTIHHNVKKRSSCVLSPTAKVSSLKANKIITRDIPDEKFPHSDRGSKKNFTVTLVKKFSLLKHSPTLRLPSDNDNTTTVTDAKEERRRERTGTKINCVFKWNNLFPQKTRQRTNSEEIINKKRGNNININININMNNFSISPKTQRNKLDELSKRKFTNTPIYSSPYTKIFSNMNFFQKYIVSTIIKQNKPSKADYENLKQDIKSYQSELTKKESAGLFQHPKLKNRLHMFDFHQDEEWTVGKLFRTVVMKKKLEERRDRIDDIITKLVDQLVI